jgi:heptose I phosphotransferase
MMIINESFKKLFPPKNLFDYFMQQKGEVYRKLENRCTSRFEYQGKYYFIKQHFGVGWKEIFKNMIQGRWPILSAKNEWLANQKLQTINIPSIEILAYGERGWNPAKRQSFLVSEELLECQSLEDLCRDWQPSFSYKREMSEKIAVLARTLHAAGLNHRDFYLCHLWWHEKERCLYLMDLHRAQIRKTVPRRWLVKDIAGLYFSSMDIGLTARDVLRFLKIYFQKTLKEILREERQFLLDVEQRSIRLYQKTFGKSPPPLRERVAVCRDAIYRVSGFFKNFSCNQQVYDNYLSAFFQNPEYYFQQQQFNEGLSTALKRGDTSTVICFDVNNRSFLAKRSNILNFFHLLKRCMGRSRAKKAWQASCLLREVGIPIGKPAGFLEKVYCFGLFHATSYFVMEYVPGVLLNQYITQSISDVEKESIADRIIAIFQQMIEHRITHGDLKATNFLVQEGYPILIDVDSVKMHKSVVSFDRCFKKDMNRFMRNWTEDSLWHSIFTRKIQELMNNG